MNRESESDSGGSGYDQPLLDVEIVASLYQLGQRRGRDLLGQLIDLFLQQGPDSIVTLRRALAEGDASQVSETAHALKGSYRSLGTIRLAERCAELEQLGRAGELSRVGALIDGLERDFVSTRDALEAYARDLKS